MKSLNSLRAFSMLADIETIPIAVNTTKAIFQMWSKQRPAERKGRKWYFPLCIECRERFLVMAPKPPSTDDSAVSEGDSTLASEDIEVELVGHVHEAGAQRCTCCVNMTEDVVELRDSESDPSIGGEELSVNEPSNTDESTPVSNRSVASTRNGNLPICDEAISATSGDHVDPAAEAAQLPEVYKETAAIEELSTEAHQSTVEAQACLRDPEPLLRPSPLPEVARLVQVDFRGFSPAESEQSFFTRSSSKLSRSPSMLKRKLSSAKIRANLFWDKMKLKLKITKKDQ
ncbi:hypothetical protein HDU83_008923 [Entophlyctis luteolus]|nr:hypothetical protein HDU83_008923 [Entophlyctis luteolus]KAJ3390929.1 hypothetical protein HDU84_006773 [Entophlyctis sp. JEL0112]